MYRWCWRPYKRSRSYCRNPIYEDQLRPPYNCVLACRSSRWAYRKSLSGYDQYWTRNDLEVILRKIIRIWETNSQLDNFKIYLRKSTRVRWEIIPLSPYFPNGVIFETIAARAILSADICRFILPVCTNLVWTFHARKCNRNANVPILRLTQHKRAMYFCYYDEKEIKDFVVMSVFTRIPS